jgi:hypothetical protein
MAEALVLDQPAPGPQGQDLPSPAMLGEPPGPESSVGSGGPWAGGWEGYLFTPIRCGLDLGPPVYVYGSHATHCDIQCTTNTTRPAGPFPGPDPLEAPDQPIALLPYEYDELLQLADKHLQGFQTPLEVQHHNKHNFCF